MTRRRWPLETFWGNVMLIPLLGLAMYHLARQESRWWLAAF